MKHIIISKNSAALIFIFSLLTIGCSSSKTGNVLLTLDTSAIQLMAPQRADGQITSKILSIDLSRFKPSASASATTFANPEVESLYLHADFDYGARQGTIPGVEVGKYRIAAKVIDPSNGAIISIGSSDIFLVGEGSDTSVTVTFGSSSGGSTPLAIPLFTSKISGLNTNPSAISATAIITALNSLANSPKSLIDNFMNAPSPTQSPDGSTVWSYNAGSIQYTFTYTPKATGGNSFMFQSKNGEANPTTIMSGTTEPGNASASLDLYGSTATLCKSISLSWAQSNGNLTASLSTFSVQENGVCALAATSAYAYTLNGADGSGSLKQTGPSGSGTNIIWNSDGSGRLETIDSNGKTTKTDMWAS